MESINSNVTQTQTQNNDESEKKNSSENDKHEIITCETFEQMNLNENLLRGIYAYGWDKPSYVQQKGILPVINGNEVICQAQSGCGKTGTFSISAIQKVKPDIKTCQVIILSPTREIADQTLIVIRKLSTFLDIKISGVIGGKKLNNKDVSESQIIVATPGRVFDMINRGIINMETVHLFCIDEADQMLDRGFKEQMYSIFQFVPPSAQFALYSATMPPDILEIITTFMSKPIKILVKKEQLTLDGIQQFFVSLDSEQNKYDTLCDLYSTFSIAQSMIYCSSKKKVSWLADKLETNGFPISQIHGDITQTDRDKIMTEFRVGKTRVLITTDLLARGIDVQQVSVVINYDLPRDRESYIHRIGRTGRYGRKGTAINFIASQNDAVKMRDIEVYYNTQIEEMPANISEIVK